MLIELLTKRYPGMRQWLTQRLSALMMAMYTVMLVSRVAWTSPANAEEWHAFFSPWWWQTLTLLFWLCLTMHAWLGVRDVLKDYIFNVTARSYLQLLVDVALLVDLIWLVMILMKLNTGAA